MRLFILLLLCSSSLLAQELTQLSIYFPNDSDAIVLKESTKLDSIKKTHLRDSLHISLSSYANAYASKSYNLRLAQKRLIAVLQKLDHFTIDNTRVVGELPTYSWKGRRVDIALQVKEKNIPDSSQFKINEPIADGNKRRMLSSRTLDITSYSELKINETTVLFGVFFQGGTDKMLGSSSVITLRKVVRFLKGYPTRKILITGHICCAEGRNPEEDGRNNRNGSPTLSVDRAKIVYDYLIKNGISSDRLLYKGKAYIEPLDWEETKNRRVEMTILE